ncbi:MAG: hypothetical protein AB2L24_04640 [Mangrovibacterium sp.]
MKRLKCLFIVFIWFSVVYGQIPIESQKYLNETFAQPNLDKEELLSEFIRFDYSPIWMKNDKKILGFIGDDYQRINVKYLSIIKNADTPSKYYIYGKNRVKLNVCQFMGEIELTHVRKISDPEKQQLYEEAKRQNDEEAISRFSKQEYILLAKYQYFENPNQKGAGIFEGILKTGFYVDNDKIFYNDLEINSDNFFNNQCVGTWTSYANNSSKRCNWGEFRIPYSGDLDIGAGEFSPNTKYLNKGWDAYYKAFIQNDTNALKEEEFAWWQTL